MPTLLSLDDVREVWFEYVKPRYDNNGDIRKLRELFDIIAHYAAAYHQWTNVSISEYCYTCEDIPSSLYKAFCAAGFIDVFEKDLDVSLLQSAKEEQQMTLSEYDTWKDKAIARGKILRKHREALGLTIPQLVRLLGMGHATWYKLEGGQTLHPKIETMQKAATLFNIDCEELL